MFSVLFHPETFWKEIREHRRDVNAMKDYAAPVIAMVQLCKIPFIGVPRMAMFAAIVSFIVDVAVLYLLSGAIFSILGRDQPESVQHDVMTMLSYSLTPVWLAEPWAVALGVSGRRTSPYFVYFQVWPSGDARQGGTSY